MLHFKSIVALFLVLAISPTLLAEPLGSAFTYQGTLEQSGLNVTDTCDFEFGLWDAESGGAEVAVAIDVLNVPVSNGVFTVELDFGPDVFDGNTRWLEIAVVCPAGGGLTTLANRQELTPTPNAIYALSAGTVDWSGLSNIPPDLADGDNQDLAGVLAEGNNAAGTAIANVGALDATSVTGDAFFDTRNTVTGINAIALGGNNNTVSEIYSSVGGGRDNVNDSQYSAIGGGRQNTIPASGQYGTIGGGFDNTAIGERSVVGGGTANTASGTVAVISGGSYNTTSGTGAIILGGDGNEASNEWAAAFGEYAHARSYGQFAHASGRFGVVHGTAQAAMYVLRTETTDGVTARMSLNGATTEIDQVHIGLEEGQAMTYRALVVAIEDEADGTDDTTAGWECSGLIVNPPTGVTVSIGGNCDQLAIPPTGWNANALALGSDNKLIINVTGAAATNIRWVATIHTVEAMWPQ